MVVCLFLMGLVVEWEGVIFYEMGDLIWNQFVIYEFVFCNVSGEFMVIDNVWIFCGCMVFEWDEVFIVLDFIGVIVVIYDVCDLGYFKKKVKVYFSNQCKVEVFFIEGWVEEFQFCFNCLI